MNTSNLSQTTPLVVAPSLPPWIAWVSGALRRIKALQMQAFETQGPSEQAYHQISFTATPISFYRKGHYPPFQDWYGYR